ncbi:cysteine-rich receptor-like protein kinase 26, partial [Tanacetum coccineum]
NHVLQQKTNDFSDDNKLGQGGFGAVYKGVLEAGHQVAVKRLAKDSGQGDVEFNTTRNLTFTDGFSDRQLSVAKYRCFSNRLTTDVNF